MAGLGTRTSIDAEIPDLGSGRGQQRWHDLCQVTRLEVLTLSQPSGRSSGEDE